MASISSKDTVHFLGRILARHDHFSPVFYHFTNSPIIFIELFSHHMNILIIFRQKQHVFFPILENIPIFFPNISVINRFPTIFLSMGEKSQQSLYHYFLSQQYFIIVFPPYQYFIYFPTFFFYLSRNFPQPGPKFRPLGGALGVDASAGRLCVRGASGGGRPRPWLVAGLRGPWKNGGFFQVSWFPLGKKWVGC